MKLIPLTQGQFAQVDDEDFEWLNQYKWYALSIRDTFYAQRSIWVGTYKTPTWKSQTIAMHRQIMSIVRGDGILCDHMDHNGLNCQRDNLRIATRSQNVINSRNILRKKSSKYRGVCFKIQESNGKEYHYWVAQIQVNEKTTFIGKFHTEDEAGLAYNEYAIRLHGEFAILNEI